jgi:glycyl-tRNA synthetase alpha chain
VDNFLDLKWSPTVTYETIHYQGEVEYSHYNFEEANVPMLFALFDMYEKEAKQLLERHLGLPAYDYCLKCSHVFNLLDARGAIGVDERTTYIARVRGIAHGCAKEYLERRNQYVRPH